MSKKKESWPGGTGQVARATARQTRAKETPGSLNNGSDLGIDEKPGAAVSIWSSVSLCVKSGDGTWCLLKAPS